MHFTAARQSEYGSNAFNGRDRLTRRPKHASDIAEGTNIHIARSIRVNSRRSGLGREGIAGVALGAEFQSQGCKVALVPADEGIELAR